MGRKTTNDVVDAAVGPDNLEHAASHHGNDDELTHANYALAHGIEPTIKAIVSLSYADDAAQDNAGDQHSHHIETTDGSDPHGQIRNDAQVVDMRHMSRNGKVQAHKGVNDKHNNDSRCHNHTVDFELIAHLAALCLSGHNGSIGDKRKVIAKVSTTYNHSSHQCQITSCLPGNTCGNRYKGHHSAHTGTNGDRHKAGSQEQSWKHHACRKHVKREVDGGVDGSHLLSRLGERSGQDVNPQHEQQIGSACATAVDVNTGLERVTTGHSNGIYAGYQKKHRHGHPAKVVGHQAQQQVEHDKHQ